MPGVAEPTLHSRRAGSGDPLLLVHGIGSSLRAWAPVLPALEEAHDVLALDLPGFGESPPLAAGEPSTIPSMADALERELDAAAIDTAHLVGNSLGGWLALELARRGRARSVVALSPAGMWFGRENAYARIVLRSSRAGARLARHWAGALTRTPARRAALLSTFFSGPRRLAAEEAAYAIRVLARAPAFDETLDWTLSHRAEGLDEIRCPVLIAWGTRDRLLLPRQGRRFARRIPGAELRSLPGLGHLPMSDDPELVARTILDFTAGAAARRDA